MKNRVLSDQGGMTLVELMFAVGVVGAALAMMFGSLMTVSFLGELSQQRTNAMGQVNSILEEIRGLSREDLLRYRVPAIQNGPGNVNVAVALAYGANNESYYLPQITSTTTTPPTVNLPNPTEVRVLFVWMDARGRVYHVESSTCVEL